LCLVLLLVVCIAVNSGGVKRRERKSQPHDQLQLLQNIPHKQTLFSSLKSFATEPSHVVENSKMSSKGDGGVEELLLCYNRGCGQQYKESENTNTSCRFHPGTPYFHDAYKGWTCCRKSTDFTEFLNMKGCAYSFHSNEKPPEEEKKKQEVSSAEIIEVCQPKYVPLARPSLDTQMVSHIWRVNV